MKNNMEKIAENIAKFNKSDSGARNRTPKAKIDPTALKPVGKVTEKPRSKSPPERLVTKDGKKDTKKESIVAGLKKDEAKPVVASTTTPKKKRSNNYLGHDKSNKNVNNNMVRVLTPENAKTKK